MHPILQTSFWTPQHLHRRLKVVSERVVEVSVVLANWQSAYFPQLSMVCGLAALVTFWKLQQSMKLLLVLDRRGSYKTQHDILMPLVQCLCTQSS
jgi:hypothetical protein